MPWTAQVLDSEASRMPWHVQQVGLTLWHMPWHVLHGRFEALHMPWLVPGRSKMAAHATHEGLMAVHPLWSSHPSPPAGAWMVDRQAGAARGHECAVSERARAGWQ